MHEHLETEENKHSVTANISKTQRSSQGNVEAALTNESFFKVGQKAGCYQ